MFLNDLFYFMEGRDDADHFEALRKTGFFGAQAAGCIFLARDTKRFLLAHRSEAVEQPGTFGSWGGAIDQGEDPEAATRREALEEAGHDGPIDLIPLFVFRNKSFRYSNFLALVDHEFTPVLNWETQGFRWCPFGKWPKPLHFGLTAVFSDPASIATIQKTLQALNAQPPAAGADRSK